MRGRSPPAIHSKASRHRGSSRRRPGRPHHREGSLARVRLGVGFEEVLYPGQLATVGPDLRQGPRPGALDFLLRTIEELDVTIYPLTTAPGRAAQLQWWVWRQARDHFIAAGHPSDQAAADRLIDFLAFTEQRIPAHVTLEATSFWWPGPADWPSNAALLAAAGRGAPWWCEAT